MSSLHQDGSKNRRVTASFITQMVIGQVALGNSNKTDGLVPETYTLQLSYVDIQPDSSGKIHLPSAQAEITWKIDGQHQRRVISIVSGASISGVCNAVDVKILDIPQSSFVLGLKYKVQATLSRGIRGDTEQPPVLLTTPNQSVPTVGPPLRIPIPQDAGVINLFAMMACGGFAPPPLTTDFVINFLDVSAAGLGSFYPLLTPGWIPIPPGSQFVQINTNVPLANTTFAQLVWGVEG